MRSLGHAAVTLLSLLPGIGSGCLGATIVGSEARTAGTAFALRSGVIVDVRRAAVYLMDPRGGIDAVDLSSGTLLWTATQAAKPLWVSGHLLIAQAESGSRHSGLRIAILDTRQGSVVQETTVNLPEHVRASVNDGLGTSFEAVAHEDDGEVVISWRFSRRTITGVAPGPETLPEAPEARGAVRLKPETGGVEPMPTDALLAAGSPGSTTGSEPSRPVGRFQVSTERTREGTEECVVLMRTDRESGKAVPDVTLFCGRVTVEQDSADGAHLLVSRRVEDAASAEEQYAWSIYALETGRRVAEIRHYASTAPFFVSNSVLVHEARPYDHVLDGKWIEEPLRLRAINVETGAVIWSRPLRDTTYHRPYPPS